MDLPRPLRLTLATLLVAMLAAVLAVALVWAYDPEEGGGIRFRPDAVPLEPTAAPSPAEPAGG